MVGYVSSTEKKKDIYRGKPLMQCYNSATFRLCLFNRDLNRGCLVNMFSLHFSGSKFLIILRRQMHVRRIFLAQVFAGFAVFLILCLKLLFRNCATYVLVTLSLKLAH